jgi:hypothetical protein
MHTNCLHVNTAAANALCESFKAPKTKPAKSPVARLTTAAIKAHRAYRIAKAANLKPIQSTRETRAHAKYNALHAELAKACRAEGIDTPQTWNL